MVGIYRITSPSGKVYIGQSININSRFRRHRWNENRGKTHLDHSFKKYGFKNHAFEVIHELPKDVKHEILHTYEILYIEIYKSAGYKLLNTSEGGKGGFVKHRPESLIKMSEAQKGKRRTEEQKRKISQSLIGRECKPETVEKIRKALSGRKLTPEQIAKITGLKRSDETRKKLSIANKGRPGTMKGKKHSEETRAKLSIAKRGVKYSDERRLKMIGQGKGRILSTETRQKISSARMGIQPSNKGKPMPEEQKKKLSEAAKKRVYSPEARAKFSEAKKAFLKRKNNDRPNNPQRVAT